MALPTEFLEELRGRTPIASLIGRRVKLARAGRQWKGCCPFHDERSPSFFVYDDHYHCFGCGAHGDAISYVMASTGSEFLEAVAQLAAEAGLEVPADPAAVAASRRHHDVMSALGAAQAVYERWLHEPRGRPALDYLHSRGLTDETIAAWGIGWSGDGHGALAAALRREDVPVSLLVDGGLMREGGEPYDLFFDRVMFPIRDRRGRPIGFGGRVLDARQPKYLNGPETDLFSKRRVLYGLDVAHRAIARGEDLIVVEGYLDVISMHQAGIEGAVAPLGTALTADHLTALWRLAPVPMLCFDGDAAGVRATARAVETALPMLTPQCSLKLVRLAGGEDPDSMIRQHGVMVLRRALAEAVPLSEGLFDLLRSDAGDGTPEARAALQKRLEDAAASIEDKALSREYRKALLNRYFEFRPWRRDAGNVIRLDRPQVSEAAAHAGRAQFVIGLLLRNVDLIDEVAPMLNGLALPAPCDRLWSAMASWAEAEAWPTDEGLADAIEAAGLTDAADMVREACEGADADEEALLREIARLMDMTAEIDRVAAEAKTDDAAWDRLVALLVAQSDALLAE